METLFIVFCVSLAGWIIYELCRHTWGWM